VNVELAAVMSTHEPERLYSGLSVLVSIAVEGTPCAALAAFGALDLLLDDGLERRVQELDASPSLTWAGRETFCRSIAELRDQALELDDLTIYACSASMETMGLSAADVEPRLAGVLSTPRFLREVRDAQLVVV
jgi:predicted peroxiredoxin